LTAGELDECQREIRCLRQRAADLEAAGDLAFASFQREPFAGDATESGLPVLRKIENTRRHSEVFRRLSAQPMLVATTQNLIGPDLLLFRSTLMLKPALHGSAHGLHQDSAYWPIDPPNLVTVSIALNEATVSNGCFLVIPGSHKWGLQSWGRIARERDAPLTDRDDLDLSAQIDVPQEAGSALFFHSLLVHGSGANTSPRPRHTALYAYFSPSVRYLPAEGAPRTKVFPVISGLDGKEEFTLTAADK
jgi:ectoine hydroxylase-related dioxygenase (phytanoyl-CoA dioxygenase family)